MDEMPVVAAESLMPVVRDQVEDAVRKVMEAVNAAPPGKLVSASEEAVRNITADLRKSLFEAALQCRVDAAEAALPRPMDAQTGKRKRHKGRQPTTVLTINGRVELQRIRWYSRDGSTVPVDALIQPEGERVTPGVRELACRLNHDAASFDKSAANLERAAQVQMSGEQLRQLVEAEGGRVLAAQKAKAIAPAFTAQDCLIPATALCQDAATPPAAAQSDDSQSANTQPSATPCADTHGGDRSITEPQDVESRTTPSHAAQPSSTACLPCPPAAAAKTRLYLGVDGVMVPTVTQSEKQRRRQKVIAKRRQRARAGHQLAALPTARRGADQSHKEFKTITFYDETNAHRHIVLSRARRTQLSPLLRREAELLQFSQADEKVANVDGATWISTQIEASALELDGLGLDFYHLSEQVHTARRRVFGEQSAAGQQWATERLHQFKHDGYESTCDELIEWKHELRGKKREAAGKLLNYVVERRAMIQYPEFQAEGWQIGSGPTEARCKTSTCRLKRSGQRWDMDHAEQVAALGNLSDSGQWTSYWPNLTPTPT